jgi:hypothetical protein
MSGYKSELMLRDLTSLFSTPAYQAVSVLTLAYIDKSLDGIAAHSLLFASSARPITRKQLSSKVTPPVTANLNAETKENCEVVASNKHTSCHDDAN